MLNNRINYVTYKFNTFNGKHYSPSVKNIDNSIVLSHENWLSFIMIDEL